MRADWGDVGSLAHLLEEITKAVGTLDAHRTALEGKPSRQELHTELGDLRPHLEAGQRAVASLKEKAKTACKEGSF